MDAERCTTCHYFQIPMPQRYCGHPDHHRPVRSYHVCADYIHMCNKAFQDRPLKKTYAETQAVIDANAYY